MSLPERLRLIGTLLCTLSLTAGVLYAEDSTDNSADTKGSFVPRTFEAAIKNGEIVGWEQVRRVFVTCGTNEFTFNVPQGLRMDTKPNKLTLSSTDFSYFLAFRILTATDAQANPSSADSCRRHVLNSFSESKILEELSKSAAGRSGPAFEMRTKTAEATERALCVAMIPSGAGVLEFSLNADLSKSADAKNAFTALLRTFRSNERGKLEVIVQVLDNS